MLVLTRKPGEKILIGDDIVITVLETRRDGLRIGIEAPRSTRVHRAEVVTAVAATNTEAAAAGAGEGAESALRALLGGR